MAPPGRHSLNANENCSIRSCRPPGILARIRSKTEPSGTERTSSVGIEVEMSSVSMKRPKVAASGFSSPRWRGAGATISDGFSSSTIRVRCAAGSPSTSRRSSPATRSMIARASPS